MKKIFIILLFFGSTSLHSISVGDFTVKYEKNGNYFNFYDNPDLLFQIINEKNSLENIGTGYSQDYTFKNCRFSVLSREFDSGEVSPGTLLQLEKDFNVKNPNTYYNIRYFEANKDFSTIRGIGIGEDIKKVLDTYPEAVLYKNNGRYKWEVSDCYYESKIKNRKKMTDIGYVLLEMANFQYNRSWEKDFPMHYELVFVIKDSKVKSIVMQYVLDAM